MRVLAGLVLVLVPAVAGEIEGDLRLPAGVASLDTPLTAKDRTGIVIELGEAELRGPRADGSPDRFEGFGLVLERCHDVVVRGGRLRGFRCAVLVRDCSDVVLEDLDVGGNFAQRLGSTPEREDASDWLRPHDNDAQEWRTRYGAGICLERCRSVTVRRCTARRQQNGLILDRCEDCTVDGNTFSFLSGWGVALWRSSRNRVTGNRLDWCVRGYSDGVYARGQDSAGILVFEQCSDNTFAFNSATHGGDGFFLYAGEDTLRRTGDGGCNANRVFGNDFSHAVANGIEATFSRGNVFADNLCDDAHYGIWAGYSYDTRIEGNTIRDCLYAGIAIEHGRDFVIVRNRFARNKRGIQLWWDEDPDLLASAFGRAHDCASTGYRIEANEFEGEPVAILLERTSDVTLTANVFREVGEPVEKRGDCARVRTVDFLEPLPPLDLGPRPHPRDAFLPEGHPRGRAEIRVDEWGPLDPREPAVFPRRVVSWQECRFHVLGAGGDWAVRDLGPGVRAARDARGFTVTSDARVVAPFEGTVAIGERSFPIGGVVLNATWTVRHWRWEVDPRNDPQAWAALLASPPAYEGTTARPVWTWGGGGPEGVGVDRFATQASAEMTLPAGRWELRTVSDDGVRVRVDGALVQEDWTWHGPTEHRTVVELDAGVHRFELEHFELDGYAQLVFDLRPVPDHDAQAAGSPPAPR